MLLPECVIVGVKLARGVPNGTSTFIVSLIILPFISCDKNELSFFLNTKAVIFFDEDKTTGGVGGGFCEQEINNIQFIKVKIKTFSLFIRQFYIRIRSKIIVVFFNF